MSRVMLLSVRLRAMKLLIVEDNAMMRRFIKSMVADLAEEISECSDGDEAFAAYEQALPDWVLMDLQMQRVDGLTASRQIKAAYPQANICIVTEYGDAKTKAAAMEAGACKFVSKERLHELRTVIAATA
jgi:two-component system chemotaxis response regulator CheY